MKLTKRQVAKIKEMRADESLPIERRSLNALARRFDVTPNTIQYHTNEIYRNLKLGNSTRWQRENPDKHKMNVQRSREKAAA